MGGCVSEPGEVVVFRECCLLVVRLVTMRGWVDRVGSAAWGDVG
jgi:hypothetical protein